uniref:Uncharacterized protein n=1 Tax=Nelumbo nucifera TaxID=4432 RepID=A0A822ZN38_NELNU|nr:TPA_asm: hypothetical protein HUJ06_004537 [Nelumbo nucifera]
MRERERVWGGHCCCNSSILVMKMMNSSAVMVSFGEGTVEGEKLSNGGPFKGNFDILIFSHLLGKPNISEYEKGIIYPEK